MTQRDAAIDHQALALVEHRRVGGVVIGAIGASGHDHPDRRRLLQHGADLHRRGLGAQQARGLPVRRRQIEGVVVGSGGMMRRRVQGREVVPIGLDVRALGEAEAHDAEDRHDLLDAAADRMDRAWHVEFHRQGDVDPLARQAGIEGGGFQRPSARLDGGAEIVAQTVQGGPAGTSLVGSGAAQLLEQQRQPARLAQRADADGIPGTVIGRRFESGERVLPQGVEVVRHRSPTPERERAVLRRTARRIQDRGLRSGSPNIRQPQIRQPQIRQRGRPAPW